MKRKKNIVRDGLLPRMEAIPRKKGISYRYHPVGAKPITLGMDKVAAIRKVLDIIGAASDTGTIGKLWEEFRETDRWKCYSPDTRKDYTQCSGPLLLRFNDARASDIEAPDVARCGSSRSATCTGAFRGSPRLFQTTSRPSCARPAIVPER
ncbi:hypothetical protein [Burkholderia arboris]|uniref:hypothetical protein n=1 Tax=Burkholderia arboris TaxID=488730 RepID=UPI002109AD41|nr:hypothetical protein [Burkholderia arboris]UTV56509.1 hypothetical protein NLX30_09105 [Burkholderia arboris]